MIIYILLYQVKWDQRKDGLLSQASSWDEQTVLTYQNTDDQETIQTNNETWTLTVSPTPTKQPNTWTNKTWSINILSWTTLFYGKIDAIEKIGIDYDYALKDTKWIYYINIWSSTYDFDDIARKLWWTTYKITTEQEMLKNKLFGDKVTYINLPEYKWKKVLMLVYINKSIRLIEVETQLYYKSKWYLKSLFID
jgi:hypothetical protein